MCLHKDVQINVEKCAEKQSSAGERWRVSKDGEKCRQEECYCGLHERWKKKREGVKRRAARLNECWRTSVCL